MAWGTKKTFNLRQTAAFTTDNAGELCFPDASGSFNLAAYPQSAVLDSDTFNWGWSVGGGADGCRNRVANTPSAGDHRLAGLHMNTAATKYTHKLQAGILPGRYRSWGAFGDASNAVASQNFALRDSSITFATKTAIATASGGFCDIQGNIYTSGALWAAATSVVGVGGAGVSMDILTTDTSNGNGGPFLFMDIGVGNVAGTTLSNFAVQYLGPVPYLGQSASGWNPTTGTDLGFSGGAMGFNAGYVAPFTGTLTSCTVYIAAGGSAAHFKVSVYQGGSLNAGGGTLIGTTAIGNVTAGYQTVSCSIPVVSGTTYTAIISADTGFFNTAFNTGASAFGDSQYNAAAFNYASPPSTLPARTSGTGHEPLMWFDGTSGGPIGPTVVVGQPGVYSYQGGSTQLQVSASTVVSGQTGVYSYNGFPATVLKNGQPIGGGGNGPIVYRRRHHRVVRGN